MADVTQLLDAAATGDPRAAAELLPLVYDELRKLAAARMVREQPGQTLDATGLVHEAYLRLVGSPPDQGWNGRGHFFAAAAEAMRRILVESARRKNADKHGGGRHRIPLDGADVSHKPRDEQILVVDEALAKLEMEDPLAAGLVKLRYFGGLPIEQAAEALGVSRSTAYEHWAYARACLRVLLAAEPDDPC